MSKNKKGMNIQAKQQRAGWIFLAPATLMIAVFSFYPMIQAFVTSFTTGTGVNTKVADPLNYNYLRMFADRTFFCIWQLKCRLC